jgi:hypothetical protein
MLRSQKQKVRILGWLHSVKTVLRALLLTKDPIGKDQLMMLPLVFKERGNQVSQEVRQAQESCRLGIHYLCKHQM